MITLSRKKKWKGGAKMNQRKPQHVGPILAEFFLWAIRRHQAIATFITFWMWTSVAGLVIVALLDIISTDTATKIIFIGGFSIVGILWVMIERRRSWLLGIHDPELKMRAHEAMIRLIALKSIHSAKSNSVAESELPSAHP
jgi:hypothetical protein